ncbi:hypothetical protein SNE40_005032 [Patella caerulea]|uniref:Uncharacterized protein n=1 Tax=Patella caerulea TaxID=87958 RepID=A0AAN8PXX0_PATCE
MVTRLISVFVLCVCVVECLVVQNTNTNKKTSQNTALHSATNVGTGNTKTVDPVPFYSNTQQTLRSVKSPISTIVTSEPGVVNHADPVQTATPTSTGSKPASTALTEPVITTGTGGVQNPDLIPTSTSLKDLGIFAALMASETGGIKKADPIPMNVNTNPTSTSLTESGIIASSIPLATGTGVKESFDPITTSVKTNPTESGITTASMPLATETGGVKKVDPIPMNVKTNPTSTTLTESGIIATSIPLATGTGGVKKVDPIPMNVNTNPASTSLTESGTIASSIPLATGTGVKESFDPIKTSVKTNPTESGIIAASIPLATGTGGVKQSIGPQSINANTKPTSTTLTESGIIAASVPLTTGTGGVKKTDPAPSYTNLLLSPSALMEALNTVGSVKSVDPTMVKGHVTAIGSASVNSGVNSADPTKTYTNTKPTSTLIKETAIVEALNTAGGIKSADPTTVKGPIAPIGSTSASSSVNGADPTKTYTNTKPTPTLIKEPAIVKAPQHNHVSPAQPNTNIRQMLPLPERRVTLATTTPTNGQQAVSSLQEKLTNTGRGNLPNMPTMGQLISILTSVPSVGASGTTTVATSNVAGTKRTYSNYPQYLPAPRRYPHHTRNAKPPQPLLPNLPVKKHTKLLRLHRHGVSTPASVQTLPPAKPTIRRNQESHEQYPIKYFTEREKRVFLRDLNEERADVDNVKLMNIVVSFVLFSSFVVKL